MFICITNAYKYYMTPSGVQKIFRVELPDMKDAYLNPNWYLGHLVNTDWMLR